MDSTSSKFEWTTIDIADQRIQEMISQSIEKIKINRFLVLDVYQHQILKMFVNNVYFISIIQWEQSTLSSFSNCINRNSVIILFAYWEDFVFIDKYNFSCFQSGSRSMFISIFVNISSRYIFIECNWLKSISVISISGAFPPDEPLSSSILTQTFQTHNRAGFYQSCSNGRYIIADDWCQINKDHRLSPWTRCLPISNQYEEQCVLMLP
jgi:hypothetical protein